MTLTTPIGSKTKNRNPFLNNNEFLKKCKSCNEIIISTYTSPLSKKKKCDDCKENECMPCKKCKKHFIKFICCIS